MMKLTQNERQIKTYLEKNPEFAKEIVKDKNQETLINNYNRYVFMDRNNDKKMFRSNCHASIKAARYTALLFKDWIEEQSWK